MLNPFAILRLQSGIFGQFKRGAEMGKAAEILLEQHSALMLRDSVSRSRYVIQGFIAHWRAPLVSILVESTFPLISDRVSSHKHFQTLNHTEKDIAAFTRWIHNRA